MGSPQRLLVLTWLIIQIDSPVVEPEPCSTNLPPTVRDFQSQSNNKPKRRRRQRLRRSSRRRRESEILVSSLTRGNIPTSVEAVSNHRDFLIYHINFSRYY